MSINQVFLQAAADGDLQAVNSAIGKGADLGSVSADNSNALHLACQYGHPSVVATLVQAGVDVNGVNQRGRTPAHEAVAGTRASTLYQLIVHAGEAVNWFKQDFQGHTIEGLAKNIVQSQSMHQSQHLALG